MTKQRYGYYHYIHWKDSSHTDIIRETDRQWVEEPTTLLREIRIKLGLEQRDPCEEFAFEDDKVKQLWERINWKQDGGNTK